MNKKNEKTEATVSDKKVLKKLVLLKRRKKLRKIFLLGLHMFIQLLITQLFQLLMKMEMLFHGLRLEQKVLKVQENQLHTLHK